MTTLTASTVSAVESILPTLSHKLLALALLAALLFAGYFVYTSVQEHDARIKAEADVTAQKTIADSAKNSNVSIAATLKDTLAALETEKNKRATPQQIIIDGSKIIPNMPQPITIQTAPPVAGALPNAPTAQQLVIPQADFPAIHTAEITCQENAAKNDACQLTNANLQTQLTATTKQVNDYKELSEGGSKWQRFKTGLKHSVCGAAGAGIGLTVSKGNSSGAETGTVAGLATVGACELLPALFKDHTKETK